MDVPNNDYGDYLDTLVIKAKAKEMDIILAKFDGVVLKNVTHYVDGLVYYDDVNGERRKLTEYTASLNSLMRLADKVGNLSITFSENGYVVVFDSLLGNNIELKTNVRSGRAFTLATILVGLIKP